MRISRGHKLCSVIALATVSMVLGCKSGPVLSGPPTAGDGLRAEVVRWEVDDEDLELELRFTNEADYDIVIAEHQLAVVGPDGVALYERGKRVTTLRPRSMVTLELDVESHAYAFEDVKGLFVRFDGVFAGGTQLRVPPLRLGNPDHAPGDPVKLQPPSNDNASKPSGIGKLFSKIKSKVRKIAYGDEQTRVAAAEEVKGLEQYRGPRRHLTQNGVKVAVMPLKFSEVPAQAAFVADELLLTEAQQVGFEAIGPDDVAAMVGYEAMKDELGCDDAACATEIGNALGVPYLIAGSIALVEGTTMITLKLINVHETTVIARVSHMADGGTRVFPRVIAEAMQEMVERAQL